MKILLIFQVTWLLNSSKHVLCLATVVFHVFGVTGSVRIFAIFMGRSCLRQPRKAIPGLWTTWTDLFSCYPVVNILQMRSALTLKLQPEKLMESGNVWEELSVVATPFLREKGNACKFLWILVMCIKSSVCTSVDCVALYTFVNCICCGEQMILKYMCQSSLENWNNCLFMVTRTNGVWIVNPNCVIEMRSLFTSWQIMS